MGEEDTMTELPLTEKVPGKPLTYVMFIWYCSQCLVTARGYGVTRDTKLIILIEMCLQCFYCM